MGEYAPYFPGMNKGQGYNTFTQSLGLNGAVTVTSEAPPNNTPFERTYFSVLVTDYSQLVESLNITAGAAISGWGQSSTVDVEYLDRQEYESSTVTYQVKVDVKHQGRTTNQYSFNWTNPANPNSIYGDRFVADFVEGGHYYAVISITSTSESHQQEVKEAAEATMSMFGVDGTITQSVETALETLREHSRTRIVVNETTGGGSRGGERAGMDLESLKAAADDFYQNAQNHRYVHSAILEKYENVINFNNAFQPFDYYIAIQRSYPFLDEFTLYMDFQSLIKNVPSAKFNNGDAEKNTLEASRTDAIELIRKRIFEIRDDPSNGDFVQPQPPAANFRIEVLKAVKTANYIAQRVTTSTGGFSDRIQANLVSGATKLFDVKVYDFDSLEGTTLVSFGSNTSGDGYAAMLDIHANSIPGLREDSYFYIFLDQIDQVTGDLIRVWSLSSRNYIRLAKGDLTTGDLFTFRSGKA
ncbi:hypothetical protein F5I97DRAFT_1923770 [Phlebopus sp. FC_14]|nr:hypothetical protein F5I97DRAFT_1923770 [Phlebopus sp. FC_14]